MRRTWIPVAVGSLTAALVVGALVADPARDVVHGWIAERAWPEDLAAVTAAMDAVDLPDGYAPVTCPDDGLAATRCWTTLLTPEQAEPDMGAAAEEASDLVTLETSPVASAGTGERPTLTVVTASVQGTYDFQGFSLLAQRDIDEEATSVDELWLDTTTVLLVPALTPP
ncbi:hypothetical protein [Sanguibacter suaedae]|uniref:Uncharacterized protein n=1 Tax=Sanguibacter suaedae TaxID=2795737 RepID=A0A934I523_9MICO|nr:hypothetical protein [Sanguibacter suaedae]MBI9115729.1 hypothetical protein [Sanguibacter suaedae]